MSEYTDQVCQDTSHPSLEYCVQSNHDDGDPAKEVLVEFEGNKPQCLYGKTEVTKSQVLTARSEPSSIWYVDPNDL